MKLRCKIDFLWWWEIVFQYWLWQCTWSNLNKPIVLNEDSVTGQVAMNDGRVARVQITVERKIKWICRLIQIWLFFFPLKKNIFFKERQTLWNDEDKTHLRADRIWVHHLFQACATTYLYYYIIILKLALSPNLLSTSEKIKHFQDCGLASQWQPHYSAITTIFSNYKKTRRHWYMILPGALLGFQVTFWLPFHSWFCDSSLSSSGTVSNFPKTYIQ